MDTALVARSSDGGRSFAVGVPALAGATSPKLAVQPRAHGDRVYVASGRSATLARSDDGGRTWSEPFTANPAGTASAETTEPVVARDGTLHLGWRSGTDLVVGAPQDAGRTWTSTVAATVPSGGSNFHALAVDPRGTSVYLVYGRNPPEGASGPTPGAGVGARDHFIPKDSDAMFVRSLDGGRTWGTPLRVNADVVGNGIAQRHPNISVSRTGRIDVVWHDRRHAYRAPQDNHRGNGEVRLGDTYLASSFDGGKTFPAERRLTDRSLYNDVGLDYKCCSYWAYGPRSIPIGEDEILAAWSDTLRATSTPRRSRST